MSITGNGSAQAPVAERPIALPPDQGRGSVMAPANPASSYTCNVSSNGAAGDRYWEVTNRGEIIARGLAATEALARADAMRAALSHVDLRPENLPLYLEDPSSPLPRFEAA